MLLGSILCNVLNRNEVEGLFRDERLTPMCSKHNTNYTIFLLQAVQNDIHVVVGSVSKHKTKIMHSGTTLFKLSTLKCRNLEIQNLITTKCYVKP